MPILSRLNFDHFTMPTVKGQNDMIHVLISDLIRLPSKLLITYFSSTYAEWVYCILKIWTISMLRFKMIFFFEILKLSCTNSQNSCDNFVEHYIFLADCTRIRCPNSNTGYYSKTYPTFALSLGSEKISVRKCRQLPTEAFESTDMPLIYKC